MRTLNPQPPRNQGPRAGRLHTLLGQNAPFPDATWINGSPGTRGLEEQPVAIPGSVLWPLASGPERARWAALAVERYLHMARIIMTRAAAWPAPKAPFPPQARTSCGRSTRRSKPEVRADLERRELDVHPVVMDYLARGRAAEEALYG